MPCRDGVGRRRRRRRRESRGYEGKRGEEEVALYHSTPPVTQRYMLSLRNKSPLGEHFSYLPAPVQNEHPVFWLIVGLLTHTSSPPSVFLYQLHHPPQHTLARGLKLSQSRLLSAMNFFLILLPQLFEYSSLQLTLHHH